MIVTNTSPLIGLGVVAQLELLPRIFGEVLAPPEVIAEATREGRAGSAEILQALARGALRVHPALRPTQFRDRLDLGESAALALALELGAERLVIDERRGRRVAQAEGVQVIGTLGVLHLGHGLGMVRDLDGALAGLRAHGFWVP